LLGIPLQNALQPEPEENQAVQLPSNIKVEIERICRSTLHPIFISLPKPGDNKAEERQAMSAIGKTKLSAMTVQQAILSAFDKPEVSGRISAIVRDTVKETMAEEKEHLQLLMSAQQRPRDNADIGLPAKDSSPDATSYGMTTAFREQLVDDIVAKNKETVNTNMLTALDQMRKLSSNTELINTALMTLPDELLHNLRQEESSSTIRFGVIEEAVRKAIQNSGTIVQVPSIDHAMDVSHPPAAWVKQYFDQSIAAILA
jgi:hypothetical protein